MRSHHYTSITRQKLKRCTGIESATQRGIPGHTNIPVGEDDHVVHSVEGESEQLLRSKWMPHTERAGQVFGDVPVVTTFRKAYRRHIFE